MTYSTACCTQTDAEISVDCSNEENMMNCRLSWFKKHLLSIYLSITVLHNSSLPVLLVPIVYCSFLHLLLRELELGTDKLCVLFSLLVWYLLKCRLRVIISRKSPSQKAVVDSTLTQTTKQHFFWERAQKVNRAPLALNWMSLWGADSIIDL